MSNGVNFRKLAVDLRQELTACQKDYDALAGQRDEGLAREAELRELLANREEMLMKVANGWHVAFGTKENPFQLDLYTKGPAMMFSYGEGMLVTYRPSPGCTDGEKS